MGCTENSSNRDIYGNKHLHHEKRKVSNEQHDFTFQGTRKKNNICKSKESTKIRTKINEIDQKKIENMKLRANIFVNKQN